MPLTVFPALRCSLGWRRRRSQSPAYPLCELSLRLRRYPTNPSRRHAAAGSSHELCRPTAHQATRVHITRALPARFVPPAGFGHPLDGLLPSGPCRFCFTPAALLGFTLRSPTSPEVPERCRPGAPTYRFLPAMRPAPKRLPGSLGRGSWVLALWQAPATRHGFSAPTTAKLPWVSSF